MKKIFICFLVTVFALSACKKEKENLDVDWDKYPTDTHKPNSDLDNWIIANFNVRWNIDVAYRFDRFYTDINRNIAPIELDQVKPSLQMVVDGFTDPYTKLAGAAFGKRYFPKLWVLYGSGSYNTDGTVVLGSMSNARVLNLYDLNNLSGTNSENIRRRLRTVHHEFMHSLNQIVPIPRAYQDITGADYDPSWAGKSENQVRPLGFISPYASSAYTEDFAEMLAHIVVEGPIWYKNYLFYADASGFEKLKAKEAMVFSYMLTNFNIDIYELQAEVQKQLKEKYNAKDPADLSLALPFRLSMGVVNSITIDHAQDHYTTYGVSAAFNTLYNSYRDGVIAAGRVPDNMQLIFTSASTMSLRINYHNPSSGAAFIADYDFSFTIDQASGLTTFTKVVPEGTTSAHNNGKSTILLPNFEQYLLPYFTANKFIATYLPASIATDDPLYRTFAGFYVNGNSGNYFYGPVTYK